MIIKRPFRVPTLAAHLRRRPRRAPRAGGAPARRGSPPEQPAARRSAAWAGYTGWVEERLRDYVGRRPREGRVGKASTAWRKKESLLCETFLAYHDFIRSD